MHLEPDRSFYHGNPFSILVFIYSQAINYIHIIGRQGRVDFYLKKKKKTEFVKVSEA